MIVTTDIADILFRDCKDFGIKIVPFGKTLTGELTGERITIHVKGQTPETYWEKSFCEVNLCVPDLSPTEANYPRLKALERKAKEKFRSVTDTFDGTRYLYEVDTITIEADTALKCHFVNVRLLFNVLNTI
ncbi:hypothetical protein [Prevotella sp. HUN102]|uniref:hypothetical protein n=1 Tax=Prevotella sp. HUN102 TaxID=1392486 RepID=UPI000490CFD1|nr:hypothetical protein [Prevotella sp. HUN102]